jgi:hypothetical protein
LLIPAKAPKGNEATAKIQQKAWGLVRLGRQPEAGCDLWIVPKILDFSGAPGRQ